MIGETLEPNGDYLLDTGVIIRHLRNDGRAHALLDHLEATGKIRVSVITFMEIMVGCRTQEEENTSLSLFERVPPAIVSREVAQKAATLIKRYPTVFGRAIQRGVADALIAATAWEQKKVLVTFNTRQFARVSIAELVVQAIKQDAADWVTSLKA